MTTTLAKPTFVTTARDELATADVYTQTSDNAINLGKEATPASTLASAAGCCGCNGQKKELTAIVTEAKKAKAYATTGKDSLAPISAAEVATKVKVDTSMLTRLNALGGPIAVATNKLDPSIASSILGGIKNATSIFANVGGVASRIASSSLSGIANVGSLLGNITGNSGLLSITDNVAKVGALSKIISSAAGLGIPNTFGPMTAGLPINLINQTALGSLSSVTRNSDLSSLASMASLTSPGYLNKAAPNLINLFSSSYAKPNGSGSNSFLPSYATVNSTYNQINPNWNNSTIQTPSGPQTVPNISQLMGASTDFIKMYSTGALQSTQLEDKLMLLAAAYPKTNVDAQLKSDFPNTVTGIDQRQSNQLIDARTLATLPDGISTQAITETTINIAGGTEINIATDYPDGSKTTSTQTKTTDGDVTTRTTVYPPYNAPSETTYGPPENLPGTPENKTAKQLVAEAMAEESTKTKNEPTPPEPRDVAYTRVGTVNWETGETSDD